MASSKNQKIQEISASLPTQPEPLKEWYSRGYLPHYDSPGLLQFVTFRLHDSVPNETVAHWKEELYWHNALEANSHAVIELYKRISRFEDAGHGVCWLGNNEIAAIVENALLVHDVKRYHLLSWCVMPNHVHVLIETIEGNALSDVVHSWKSFSANQANKVLGRRGVFWMREYHDRFIRNAEHYAQTVIYIENNPVKAGLVAEASMWRWSSAYVGRCRQGCQRSQSLML